MKKILIPTDFSDTANKARDYAAQLALRFDAELVLSHAYHFYAGSGSTSFANLDALALKTAKEMMQKQEKEIGQLYPKLKFRSQLVPLMPVDSIVTLCKNLAIDLVVMGTTGSSGLVGQLVGSTTSHVVGKINVPVITIPTNTEASLPKHIVLATDLTYSGDSAIFEPLKELVKTLSSKIDLLNITNSDNSEEITEELKSNFGTPSDVSFYSFSKDEKGSIEESIRNYTEGKEVDLLAVVAHKRGFWENLWHKSVSKGLVQHAAIPVLVLPE